MPVPARRLASGTIWVDVVPRGGGGRAVVYARVSSHDQRADLDRQVARFTEWVTAQGIVVADVVCEVGSGMNGRRPKLRRILSDPSVAVIVVEHRDRLVRLARRLLARLHHRPESHQVIALAATGKLGMAAAGQIRNCGRRQAQLPNVTANSAAAAQRAAVRCG